MRRPRTLFVQHTLQPPGGGNGVAAWMLQALRDDHALTVLTWSPIDLSAVNTYFGTSLRPSDFAALTVPARVRALVDRLPLPAVSLKLSVLRKRAKRLRADFDLMMSAINETDFGQPGIQYVHYPVRHIAALPVDVRWYHRGWSLAVYERLWSLVAPFDDESMRSNLTLANSQWTADLVSRLHRIPVRVVHPPAPGPFTAVPWRDRENGFLCVGRLAPEKQVDGIIEILRRVRAIQPDVHLHVVGSDDDPAYAGHVREVARRAGPWVTVDGTLSIEALARLMCGHRYFIHGMREEHFGISVAQAVRAGCIPFVPDGGGQVEIIGDEPALRYRSPDDAVARIVTLMKDAWLQETVRARLAARAERFGAERFMDDIRGAATEVLARRRAD